MGAIIGPASDVKRPIFTLFSAVARAVTEVVHITLIIQHTWWISTVY